MLVSNFTVYITKQGNGAIKFIENDSVKRVIIPKADVVPKQVFDFYYNQLSSFKHRHYAIAKWIVKDIRRMGYEFKQMPMSKGIYLPVKASESVERNFNEGSSRTEKLRLLWNEVERISRKLESIK